MENSNNIDKGEYIKMPKNIRQIGNIGNHNKVIYVEDYVMTFIKQLSCRDYTGCKVAILLGYYIRTEDSRNLFIKGAIEMKEVDFTNEITFTDEAWTSIYENIKKYFSDVEIVGWSLIGPEFFLESGEKIRKVHMDNFAGSDKALLKMDSLEKEETFYFFENNHLVKQNGYYIYYEKNDEMQNYMVENKDVVIEEKSYDDQTTRRIRNIIKEKKEPKEDKNVLRLLYAASTVLAVIVLIIAAAMLNNYGQLKNMETAINAISESLSDQNGDESQLANKNQSGDITKAPDIELTADTGKTEGKKAADDGETALLDKETAKNNTESEKTNQDTEETDVAANENNSDKESNQEVNEETMEVETVSGNISADNTSDEVENPEKNTETAENKADLNQDNTGTVNKATQEDSQKSNRSESEEKTDEVKSTDSKTDVTEDNKQTVKDDTKPEKTDEAAEASAEVKYYTVKSGDSLASISLHLYKSVSNVKTIKELNGIEDENKIFAGQKLIVP